MAVHVQVFFRLKISALWQKPDLWKYLIVQVEAGFMEKILVWSEEELIKLFNNESVLPSLLVSRTGSASDWRVGLLQEVLYKCIDTIQYAV